MIAFQFNPHHPPPGGHPNWAPAVTVCCCNPPLIYLRLLGRISRVYVSVLYAITNEYDPCRVQLLPKEG